jgi:hypothetical protein
MAFARRAKNVEVVEMLQRVLDFAAKYVFKQCLVFVPGYLARD